MAVLTEDQKAFIVRELAMYSTPTEASEAVALEFGIKVERNQVAKYDPFGCEAKKLQKKWADLFTATRKAFLKDVSKIPIAQRAYRLRQLSDMASIAKRAKNLALAAQLMEQAAKECGDTYTNKLNLKHSGAVGRFELTDEQLDKELVNLMSGGEGAAGDDRPNQD